MKRLAVVCALVAAGVGNAQAPIERRTPSQQSAPDTIVVRSRLVPLALNVVDEHGSPVGGLRQDQFEVSEDGKPQTIKVFDRESSTPLSIVISLDASESVFNDEKLEHDAAKKFVKSLLRPQDEVDLMDFADNVREVVPFTGDVNAFNAGLGRLQHGAATALYDAIYLGADVLKSTEAANGRRRVLVIISDGDDTTHHGGYDTSLEQAQRANAMVFPLILVPILADAGRNEGGEHALIQMANDTGGKFYYVYDKKDLVPAFTHLSDDLRTQYTLAYYAPEKGGDKDGFRRITLRLKDPALAAKYTLRYRTGYYGERPGR